MNEQHAYGRDHIPEAPKGPRSHFSLRRPFYRTFLLFLKFAWRMTSKEEANWAGSRRHPGYHNNIDYSEGIGWGWLTIIFSSLVVSGILCAAFHSFFPLAITLSLIPCLYSTLRFLNLALGLHIQESRDYWTEKLDI